MWEKPYAFGLGIRRLPVNYVYFRIDTPNLFAHTTDAIYIDLDQTSPLAAMPSMVDRCRTAAPQKAGKGTAALGIFPCAAAPFYFCLAFVFRITLAAYTPYSVEGCKSFLTSLKNLSQGSFGEVMIKIKFIKM